MGSNQRHRLYNEVGLSRRPNYATAMVLAVYAFATVLHYISYTPVTLDAGWRDRPNVARGYSCMMYSSATVRWLCHLQLAYMSAKL